MKKIALTLALLVVVSFWSMVSAQKYRFGLSGSPSMAWFKSETENYYSQGPRLGVSYGLVSEFLMAEQYSFVTGINVNYFGGRLSFPIAEDETLPQPYTNLERTYKLQYLEVPFTLKMKTREIGYNTYYAKFGFGASVNMRAKANDSYYFEENTSNIYVENDVDIKSQTPLFRASMILGIGFEYSIGGSAALTAGLTFNNGFTNVLKGKDYLDIRNQQARANFLELSLGILF